MRSGKAILAGGLILALVILAALIGCNSDKRAAIDNNPADTSATALQYSQVEQGVTGLVDSLAATVGGLLGVVSLQNGVDTTPLPPADYGPIIPDSIRTANAWTIVYRGQVAAGIIDAYVDSVQFLLRGQVLASARNADHASLRHSWRYEQLDTTVAYRNFWSTGRLEIHGIDGGTATVSGTFVRTFAGMAGTGDNQVRARLTVSSLFSGLEFTKAENGWSRGCPSNGAFTATANLIWRRGGNPPDTTGWTITGQITSGTLSVSFTRDGQVYEYSGPVCPQS